MNSGAYTLVASNLFGAITNSVPAILTVADFGVYADGQFVTGQTYTAANYSTIDLESLYPDGYIFYTLDGSDPDFTANQYFGEFTINNSSTIRAVAYDADFSEYVEAAPTVINILPSYYLSVGSYGGGTLSVIPPSSPFVKYLSNTLVTIIATPSSNSVFMNWSGDLGGNSLAAR